MKGFSIVTDIKEISPKQHQLLLDMLEFMVTIKERYDLPLHISSFTVTPDSINNNKNDTILSILDKYGSLSAEQIINLLIKDGIFTDTPSSRSNIRSRLSRLLSSKKIERNSWGGNYRLPTSNREEYIHASSR